MDFTQLATLGKVIAADTLLGKFLTSKKGLAKAAAFAKTPTTETAKQFNNTLKAELGLSLQITHSRFILGKYYNSAASR